MANTIGGMTLAQWQAEAATLTEARDRVLRSQDYHVGDGVIQRRNRRADLDQITAALETARGNVQQLLGLEAGATSPRRVYSITPR